MKYLKTLIYIFLVVIFSYTFLPRLSIYSVTPNLILVVAIIYIYKQDLNNALIWTLVGGFFISFMNIGFPSNIFLATAIIMLLWFVTKRFFEIANIFIFSFLCLFCCFLYEILLFSHIDLAFFLLFFFNAIYSTIVALIILFILQKRTKNDYEIVSLEER